MDIIKAIENEQLRTDLPMLKIGYFVRVHLKVTEGNRERIQVFEGTIISKKGSGIKETFTVRRLSHGIGVEKVFPLHSPKIEKIEIVRKGKIRRAKLYYLRERVGKAARVKEKMNFYQKDKPVSKNAEALNEEVNESVINETVEEAKKAAEPVVKAKKTEKTVENKEKASNKKIESPAQNIDEKVEKPDEKASSENTEQENEKK